MSRHLAVLELTGQTLSVELVRKAYRKLSLKWHPDKPEGNAARFREIRAAYEFLRDTDRLEDIRQQSERLERSRAAAHEESTARGRQKKRLAEALQRKEREAARRRTEAADTQRELRSQFSASSQPARAHKYPSNYVISSSDASLSEVSDTDSRIASLRSAVLGERAPAVTTSVTRVHVQHIPASSEASVSD